MNYSSKIYKNNYSIFTDVLILFNFTLINGFYMARVLAIDYGQKRIDLHPRFDETNRLITFDCYYNYQLLNQQNLLRNPSYCFSFFVFAL